MITKKRVLSIARIILVTLLLSCIAAAIKSAIARDWAIIAKYVLCVAVIAGVGYYLLSLCEMKTEVSYKKQIFAVCSRQCAMLTISMFLIEIVIIVAFTFGIIAEIIVGSLSYLFLKRINKYLTEITAEQETK